MFMAYDKYGCSSNTNSHLPLLHIATQHIHHSSGSRNARSLGGGLTSLAVVTLPAELMLC
jgi:hypothetical protein